MPSGGAPGAVQPGRVSGNGATSTPTAERHTGIQAQGWNRDGPAADDSEGYLKHWPIPSRPVFFVKLSHQNTVHQTQPHSVSAVHPGGSGSEGSNTRWFRLL